MQDQSVTYGSYLAVDELLALQRPRSEGPEHDEMLFIVIHQVYELWFKQVLHEVDHVIALLDARRSVSRAAFVEADPHHPEGAGRAARHPRDDDAARIPVVPRSGSKRRADFNPISSGSSSSCSATSRRRRSSAFPTAAARARALDRRYGAPTLWDAFLNYLSREGYAIPPRCCLAT